MIKLSLDVTVDELKALVKLREKDPDYELGLLESGGPSTREKEFGMGAAAGATKGGIASLIGTALVGDFSRPGWWKWPLAAAAVGGGIEGSLRAYKDPKYEWLRARNEYRGVKKMLEEEKAKEVTNALA
jgi:hypothetical protein